ncbi:TetR/AcrR family transcriptional regulator [Streptomyces chrestomyceticus]|uniref:TetR/AcrR family transcriptional regulator n=1 Tax=Streptomyces chrestomyceticus TaxID=68185 RepID=UPI0035A9A91A
MTGPQKRGRGRPREAAHEERVLTAAAQLLLEGGVAACTVEAASRRSGVSKPAIYRRWPHRTALAIEAFAAHIDRLVPLVETGDSAHDLVQAVAHLAEYYQGRDGVVFAQLVAAAVLEPGTAELLNARFFAPRRAALRALWERGVARGELDPHVDPDAAIDLLFGPAAFRLLLGHQPVDVDSCVHLARTAVQGLLLTRPTTPPPSPTATGG